MAADSQAGRANGEARPKSGWIAVVIVSAAQSQVGQSRPQTTVWTGYPQCADWVDCHWPLASLSSLLQHDLDQLRPRWTVSRAGSMRSTQRQLLRRALHTMWPRRLLTNRIKSSGLSPPARRANRGAPASTKGGVLASTSGTSASRSAQRPGLGRLLGRLVRVARPRLARQDVVDAAATRRWAWRSSARCCSARCAVPCPASRPARPGGRSAPRRRRRDCWSSHPARRPSPCRASRTPRGGPPAGSWPRHAVLHAGRLRRPIATPNRLLNASTRRRPARSTASPSSKYGSSSASIFNTAISSRGSAPTSLRSGTGGRRPA